MGGNRRGHPGIGLRQILRFIKDGHRMTQIVAYLDAGVDTLLERPERSSHYFGRVRDLPALGRGRCRWL